MRPRVQPDQPCPTNLAFGILIGIGTPLHGQIPGGNDMNTELNPGSGVCTGLLTFRTL